VYREINPRERLVFTHQWQEPGAPETLVIVTLRDIQGRTEVTLAQIGLKSPDSARGHAEGWTSALANLAKHLGSTNP
jgi:uncharacterized protein YndB with AHSA1/START domain